MAISYAPFDDPTPPPKPPPVLAPAISVPTSDDTECNYIVMAFVGGIILMGIMDSLRK
jgi:hypothetical protein